MFRQAMASAALMTALSSHAFASAEADFGKDLLAAEATIKSILVSNPTDSAVVPVPVEEATDGSSWFQDDLKAQPEYLDAALKFGDAGKKFLESDSLSLKSLHAEATIKKTEACADANIALVSLAVANHYAIQPGFSMILEPFNAQFKTLYDSINSRRGLICK